MRLCWALVSLVAACRYSAPYLVVTVDAAAGTPSVAQLAVTVSSESSASASRTAPATAGAPLTWPQTLSLQLPDSSQGLFEVDVSALDASGAEVASGSSTAFVSGDGVIAVAVHVAPPLGDAAAPRPIAPLSTSIARTVSPPLAWSLAPGTDGAFVEICVDRDCAVSLATFFASGSSVTAPNLSPGVVFWRLRGVSGGVIGAATSPPWELDVGAGAPGSPALAWGTTLDVNGDGFPDLAGGAADAQSGAGLVELRLGGASGPGTPTALAAPAGGRFGAALASAGDVDGDGYADLVVGAPGASSAYLYRGGPSLGAATVIAGPDGGSFGAAVAGAGDVNGDGYADVVVGAPAAGASGRAYVWLGGASGLAQAPLVLAAPAGSSSFGRFVAGPGDVNGDGFADVIVGGDTGPAALFLGGSGGPSSGAPIAGTSGGALAGAGDFDGDGFADVVVLGAAPRILRGGANGLAAAWTLPGGTSCASAGDFDRDGFADVLVGDRGAASVSLFLGGAAPGALTPSLTLASNLASFGAAVARAGDLDLDGFDDVLVGAPDANTVALYRGAPLDAPPSTTPALDLMDAMGGFGAAVY
ncbi:MAG TPA: VCBS repeat-containing protein [Polyangia bacterium]|nr:VCBS repeat-containing protein [Polyangia bacterium]